MWPTFLERVSRQAAIAIGALWYSGDRASHPGLSSLQICVFLPFNYVPLYRYVHLCAGSRGGQRCWIPMELELRGDCEPSDRVLRTGLRLSVRAGSAINAEPSPDPTELLIQVLPRTGFSLGHLLSRVIGYWISRGDHQWASRMQAHWKKRKWFQRTKTESHWGEDEELQ